MGFGRRKSSNVDHEDRVPYNNTFGKLQRLSQWFELAGNAKINGLIEEYFNALENVYSELYAHLTPEEVIDINKKVLEIERFLDNSGIPSGYEQVKAFNRRKGSNLCDHLRLNLSRLAFKYNLEWFDVAAWSKKKKAAEPIMQG